MLSMPTSRPKVLVAMSGGVDSSVAAALLLREGYDVVGCFMRLGSPGESLEGLAPFDESPAACDPGKIRIGKQGCCSINDAADARLVAAKLGIPFYVCNFKKDFSRIIDYFVGEYNAGRTPNPCVRCNDWLKFGKLHQYARQIDAAYVASGHYARVERIDSDTPPKCQGWALRRGIDHDKDQSYVLFGAPKERLDEMVLPVGGMKKSTVRALAEEFDLPVFNKPDSQEICFVPDQDYAGLVKRRSPGAVQPGRIVDTAGKVIGEHPGQQHFTIGQRRGVGVALGYPIYVVHKDAESNTVVVGQHEDLRARGLLAHETNWLVELPWNQWHECSAKIRYNAEPVAARVRITGEDELEVEFDEPQYAVAPGQAVVCYDQDRVLGGGWIADARQ